MKKYTSLIAFFIICIFLVQHRYTHRGPGNNGQLKLTDWDALGYYIYLPSVLIYDDYKQLDWLPEIDKQYNVTGGQLYQAGKMKNGNYVYKYLGGVALLQLPFFGVAHYLAPTLGYPQDGFSAPYQYAVAIAALFYALFGIWVLRWVLKKYFDEATVAITLLLLCLATNFIQYAAADGVCAISISSRYMHWFYIAPICGIKGLQYYGRPLQVISSAWPLSAGLQRR